MTELADWTATELVGARHTDGGVLAAVKAYEDARERA